MSEYLQKAKQYKKFPYTVLTDEMRGYLQRTTLKMLKIVIRVFEKNSIRYSICGGTLLGAVKTNHFIPWDDDIDIFVFEEDYEKMLVCLEKAIPDWMVVQNQKTEPCYYHGWVKIRDKNSKVFPVEPLYKHNGVWIDIYKLRRIRKSAIPYEVSKEHMLYLLRRYQVGGIDFDGLVGRIHQNQLITQLISLENKEKPEDDYKRVVWSASKVVLDEDVCEEFGFIKFEGTDVQTIKKYSDYLMSHYGEKYMDNPIEEDRYININKIVIKDADEG